MNGTAQRVTESARLRRWREHRTTNTRCVDWTPTMWVGGQIVRVVAPHGKQGVRCGIPSLQSNETMANPWMPLDATALPSSLPEGYTNPLVAQSHLPGGRLEKPHRAVLHANCRPRIEVFEREPTKPTKKTMRITLTFSTQPLFIEKEGIWTRNSKENQGIRQQWRGKKSQTRWRGGPNRKVFVMPYHAVCPLIGIIRTTSFVGMRTMMTRQRYETGNLASRKL